MAAVLACICNGALHNEHQLLPLTTPANRDFADKLKKLGIDVQTIAPAHGRAGTIKDLQKALETPAPK